MSNYYEQKIKEINELKKTDYKQAFSLLIEELKMPYIPAKYESIFHNLYKEIKPIVDNQKVIIPQINHETILEFLNSNEYEKTAIAIDNLRNINIHKIVTELQNWITMNDKNNKYNLHIALIYENMVTQNINKSLLIKNTKINPSLNGSIFQNQEVKRAFYFLFNSFEKQPNLQKTVISEMEIYLLKTFPNLPKDGEELAKNFVNVISYLFNKNVELSIEQKKILEIINNTNFSL